MDILKRVFSDMSDVFSDMTDEKKRLQAQIDANNKAREKSINRSETINEAELMAHQAGRRV